MSKRIGPGSREALEGKREIRKLYELFLGDETGLVLCEKCLEDIYENGTPNAPNYRSEIPTGYCDKCTYVRDEEIQIQEGIEELKKEIEKIEGLIETLEASGKNLKIGEISLENGKRRTKQVKKIADYQKEEELDSPIELSKEKSIEILKSHLADLKKQKEKQEERLPN